MKSTVHPLTFFKWTRPFASMLVALAACVSCLPEGGDETSGQQRPQPPGRASTPEPAAAQDPESNGDKKLVVLTWPDYIAPGLLERFEKETGISVSIETVENSSQFDQLLSSKPGKYDVIIADDKTMMDLIGLALVQPLDKSLVPNIANISREFSDMDFDPGNAYSVPYLWGTLAVAYRKDLVPAPLQSWNLLWDDSLKGRVTLIDEPDDLFFISLLASGKFPDAAAPGDYDKAADLLVRQLGEKRSRLRPLQDGLDALDTGETAVLVTYNSDATKLKRKNPAIEVFIPLEGSTLWLDSFCISQNSINIGHAHRFIDFMVSPEAAAASANELLTASPNRAAQQFIDASLLDHILFPPPDVLAKCKFIRFDGEKRQHVDRGMKRFFALLRQQQKESADTDEPTTPPSTGIETTPARSHIERAGESPVASAGLPH